MNITPEIEPYRNEFGWRRRCSWCAVELRGWQLNRCRLCKGSDGVPCRWLSRADHKADGWKWGRR